MGYQANIYIIIIIYYIITFAEETRLCFTCLSVCMFSCPFVCLSARFFSKSYERIFMIFFYYCDCYRQPRIKHENPRQRFELSECFSVYFSVVGALRLVCTRR